MSADLLTTLLQFQPDAPELKQRRDYDHAARAFVSQLSNIAATHWAKGADTAQDVLSVLNPTANSIAYAFALRHRITAIAGKNNVPDALKPGGELWNKLVAFLESFDPVQMRYAGQEWKKLVEFTEQIARASGSPSLAVAPIRSAMIQLDPTTGSFTSTHLSFIRLCMETRSYAAAEPILDNYIHSLPSKIPIQVREGLEYSVPCSDVASSAEYIHLVSGHSDKVTLADVQEYYVLGAMAYTGLRQFKKAQQFLEHVLVAPTSGNTANGLMLEAYKKWTLLNCLVNETDKVVPRTTNSQAIKQVKLAAKAYEALAEAHAQLGDLTKLRAQIKTGADVWAEDGNAGLVKEVLDSQMRTYVSRLSRTFSAIPVSHMANNVGGSAEEAAQYLETLIAEGYLNARLEQSDKSNVGVVLRFYLDPTQGPLAKTEKQQQQALFEQTLRTNMLAEQVKDADYRLLLTKEFIDNLKKHNKRPGQSGEAMDTAWDDGIDAEEDIMTDLQ
ncbi:hypothetical protein P153DRAFT_380456 [Dothidotthia symphoricarpi CBS 119687]|uniref:COP9 signalosome complex subunit 3 n=1 Tax=Dothidotthia symphoricarpi CBS 119687 TaxID=1392245 RepID=A0A6A6ASU7_9PLEO|nr:uncharacterized protein P153DRAFT_380456 [Dothidotthia symphoricarpi CBS 119687]KAF2134646.1 hypothetical protein P153DRAFT_380456 [Dothidotthia symphoricarpi CBS 119687]